MKKLLLFITILTFGISTINAQDGENPFAKGKWITDFQIGMSNADVSFDGTIDLENETKENSWEGEIGYFLADNFAAGLTIAHGMTESTLTNTTAGTSSYNENEFDLTAVFAQYFFGKDDATWRGFLKVAAGSLKMHDNNEDATFSQSAEGNGFAYLVAPGVVYMLADNVGLELTYNYLNADTIDRTVNGNWAGNAYTEDTTESFSSTILQLGVLITF